MNIEIANALSGYLETLYRMNKMLIRLCGIKIMTDEDLGDKLVLDLIQDIPRVIPYSQKNGKLVCKNKDGLLEFAEELPEISNAYEQILQANYDFLDNVRLIRNKYEHKMHDVQYKASSSNADGIFEFDFNVAGKSLTVTAEEFISTVKMLNLLFAGIVDAAIKFACDEEKTEYPYYMTLCRHDFKDFNKVYESDLLKTVGRILKEYR